MAYLSLALSSGTFIHISRSNRPALRNAGSKESGRFVAPITRTGLPPVFSSDRSGVNLDSEPGHTVHAGEYLRYDPSFKLTMGIVTFWSDSINFIDKHKTWRTLSGFLKQFSDSFFRVARCSRYN